MTREQSTMMKGVAILLMLFLHLFNHAENVALTSPLLFVGDTALVSIMARATNPVAFFLFLGGYGLYKVWQKGDKHRISRIVKLYLHYWAIITAFLIIGHFINPEKYPGGIIDIINNYTSFNTTYNAEMWFLLPYVVVSLLSPWLFRLCERVNPWLVVLGTLFIHLCTSFCISRYGAVFLYTNMWIYNPLLVFHMLFNFMLGATVARCRVYEKLKDRVTPPPYCLNHLSISVLAVVLAVLLFTVACYFKYFYGYAFFFMTALLYCPIPKWGRMVLCSLGKHSMNMWMIHSWFCYYLFKSFIYGFKYPIVIFVVLVVVSFLSSVAIEMMLKPVERKIFTKNN